MLLMYRILYNEIRAENDLLEMRKKIIKETYRKAMHGIYN